MTEFVVRKTREEPGAAEVAVTVPPDEVRAAEDRATRAYQGRAKLPGFRKGKAPAGLVRKHFAEDIREQALQELLREGWKRAVEQERLQPVADPHVHNLTWDEGSTVRFELHVEVKPEITLPRLGGFHLTRKVAAVTEAQVETQLQELRERRAVWTPAEGERPSTKDLAHVTIAQGHGEVAHDAQSFQLVLGEGRAIPEVEERIMALTPGEAADVTVRFPDDFPDAAKRGQTRDIRITLHEVKRQQLPELTDDFAREVGDFDSLAALRAAVLTDLEREAVREADARVRADLVEQLVAANNVVAPNALVERALSAYAQAYGIPEERRAEFTTEFRPVAEAQVRRDLVLDHVADSQQLRATPEELETRLRELAERRGMPVAELRASLEKSQRLRDVRRSLTEEKVFAFLLAQSTVEQA